MDNGIGSTLEKAPFQLLRPQQAQPEHQRGGTAQATSQPGMAIEQDSTDLITGRTHGPPTSMGHIWSSQVSHS